MRGACVSLPLVSKADTQTLGQPGKAQAPMVCRAHRQGTIPAIRSSRPSQRASGAPVLALRAARLAPSLDAGTSCYPGFVAATIQMDPRPTMEPSGFRQAA